MPLKRYGLHDSVSYRLNRLLTAIRDLMEDSFDEHNITVAQWTVLISVYNGGAETPAELAEFIGIDRSAVTRLLDRLETKGLLRRSRHGSDRRSVTVQLTAAGRKLTPKLIEISKRANQRLSKGISPGEARQFHSVIEKMLGNLR